MAKRPYQLIEKDVLASFHGCRPAVSFYRLNAELEQNTGPIFGRRRRTIESAAMFLPADYGQPEDVLARTPTLFDAVFAERLAECQTAHERAVEYRWQLNLRDAYAQAPKTAFKARYPTMPQSNFWPRIPYGDTAIRTAMPEPEAFGTKPSWDEEQEPVKAALRAMGANVP